jgi:hypothetical protein
MTTPRARKSSLPKSAAQGSNAITYYLAVESYGNWEFDRKNGFSFLGISNRYSNLSSRVKKGDIVFMYVRRPRSSFADARRVIADGNYHERRACDYDVPLSTAIKTQPMLTLPVEKWVTYKAMAPKLSFIGNPPRNSAMRQSFRKLESADAASILKAFEAAASK